MRTRAQGKMLHSQHALGAECPASRTLSCLLFHQKKHDVDWLLAKKAL